MQHKDMYQMLYFKTKSILILLILIPEFLVFLNCFNSSFNIFKNQISNFKQDSIKETTNQLNVDKSIFTAYLNTSIFLQIKLYSNPKFLYID